MFKPSSTTLIRSIARATPRASLRRAISTVPPTQRSRSWRSSAVRWAVAIGGLYYYNTSEIFADAPSISSSYNTSVTAPEPPAPTLESIAAARREKNKPSPPISATLSSSSSSSTPKTISPSSKEASKLASGDQGTLEETEEEAGQQAAYNEETGEINWDCPCLGGMAHGPCGEQFKEAFSCFVYSKEEPKGMDCIDHFKKMQECFKAHPDHYGDELSGDEDDIDDMDEASVSSPGRTIPEPRETFAPTTVQDDVHYQHKDKPSHAERKQTVSDQAARSHSEPTSESNELVPKEWHDTTEKNK